MVDSFVALDDPTRRGETLIDLVTGNLLWVWFASITAASQPLAPDSESRLQIVQRECKTTLRLRSCGKPVAEKLRRLMSCSAHKGTSLTWQLDKGS